MSGFKESVAHDQDSSPATITNCQALASGVRSLSFLSITKTSLVYVCVCYKGKWTVILCARVHVTPTRIRHANRVDNVQKTNTDDRLALQLRNTEFAYVIKRQKK